MWFLVWITMFQNDIDAIVIGEYHSLEECLYDMREAEVVINKTYESMVCVTKAGSDV